MEGAKSFVDDLCLGRGVVLSRAATSLRSIETKPLTARFVRYRRAHLSQITKKQAAVWLAGEASGERQAASENVRWLVNGACTLSCPEGHGVRERVEHFFLSVARKSLELPAWSLLHVARQKKSARIAAVLVVGWRAARLVNR